MRKNISTFRVYIRNYLFISNTNLERFIKNVQTNKIQKDSASYELHIISMNLRANVEEAKRFLQKESSYFESPVEKEEIEKQNLEFKKQISQIDFELKNIMIYKNISHKKFKFVPLFRSSS